MLSTSPAAEVGKPAGDDQAPRITTRAFAQRGSFRDIELSPEGDKIAVWREVDGKPTILVLDTDTLQLVARLNVGEEQGIEWFRWAGNEKLLISVSAVDSYFGSEARYTRLVIGKADGSGSAFLNPKNTSLSGDDVIFLAEDGSYALVSLQRTPYHYPGVYRYDLTGTGDVTRIMKPKEPVWSWYTDNLGTVRLGMGWRNKRLRIYYRPNGDANLKLIAKLKEDEEDKFWDVAQIVEGSDKGYVLDEDENGRVGLRLFDYATREVIETVYENPDWDLESVWLKRGEPVAAFYTDDRDQIVWFDKEYEELYAKLKAALKVEDVWVMSRSENDERMIVWAGSEADPGVLYLYTPAAQRMDQLAEYRPMLDFRALARPKPVKYTARDGQEISAYLTLPKGKKPEALPLIILPHGGPYGVRDKLRYDDEVQLLANRGYAVLQPNFRGSGGYGEEFFELGTGQIGRGMQDDLDDAMDWAVEQGIADSKRVCVVGASYGGYAALWAVIRNPERYRCAASWAGVTDWDTILKYDRRYMGRQAGKRWRARVEGEGEFDLDAVSPYRHAETLSRPVLLAHGTDDNNVPFKQFKRFEKAAESTSAHITTLVIEDEGHSFSKPENEQKWFDALDVFLAKHNPAD